MDIDSLFNIELIEFENCTEFIFLKKVSDSDFFLDRFAVYFEY